LTHHTVAAALLSSSTRAFPQSILTRAQRISIFERLGRRVETVRHVRVHTTHPICRGPRAHATRDCLVVRKLESGACINAANRQVVHRPLARSGYSVR